MGMRANSRRLRRHFVLAVVGSVALQVAPRVPVLAADTQTPVLNSFARIGDKSVVNGQTITIEYNATDNTANGLASVVFGFTSSAGRREIAATGTAAPGGPARAGVASTWAAGPYELQDVRLTDQSGNSAAYHRNGTVIRTPAGATGPSSHTLLLSAADFTVVRPPPAPTSIQAMAGAGSALVRWALPADGSPANAYVVTATPGGAVATATGQSTDAVVEGLVNGTSYSFTVTGMNDAGTGPKSATSPTVKPSAVIELTKPFGREVMTTGQAQTITWKYVAGAGTSVRLDLTDGRGDVANIATAAPIGSGGVGSFNWTPKSSLPNGHRYRIRITAGGGTDTNTGAFIIRTARTPAPKSFTPSGQLVQPYAASFMGKGGGTALTPAQALDLASRYDLVAAQRGQYVNHVATMRGANSRFRIVGYQNAAFVDARLGAAFPDSWYARDAGGNRVRASDSKNYMMQIGLPAWQDYLAEDCSALLAATGFDGCILDVLGTGPLLGRYSTSQPINPATGQAWTTADWIKATTAIAARSAEVNPSAMRTGNGLRDGGAYYSGANATSLLMTVLQGCMAELWLRTNPFAKITEYKPEDVWKKDVNMLVDAGAGGKSVFVMVKPWAFGATRAQKESWHKYALASFLLGTNGLHYFTFPYTHDLSALTADHPWDHVDVGQPTAAYGKVTVPGGGYYYARSFTKGLAVVNPTTSTVTVNLGGTYTDLSGQPRSSVTLGPNSGEVLTKTPRTGP